MPKRFYCVLFLLAAARCGGTPTPKSDTLDAAPASDRSVIALDRSSSYDHSPGDGSVDIGCDSTCETPPGDCYHSPGVCVGGACQYVPEEAGFGCDDGDECTVSDQCDGAGKCVGEPSCPVTLSDARATPSWIRTSQQATVLFTAEVIDRGANVASVTLSLSTLAMSANQDMYDDGTHGDEVAGDGLFSYAATLAAWSLTPASHSLMVTATRGDGSTLTSEIPFDVQPAHPRWRKIAPPTPEPRYYANTVYDSANDRVVVFGGESWGERSYANDVWTWTTKDGWRKLTPFGSPPPARAYATAIYDPSGKRLIVFGGTGDTGDMNDLWALTLTPGQESWQRLQPTGALPGPRSGMAATYDSNHHRMIVFGGWDDDASSLTNELWVLDLAVGHEKWTKVSWNTDSPLATWGPALAYDQANDRSMLFGGDANFLGESDQLWSVRVNRSISDPDHVYAQWTPLSATGPAGRSDHGFIYEAAKNRFILWGGYNENDIWSLSAKQGAESWTKLSPSSADAQEIEDQTGVLLPTPATRLWVFAGAESTVWRIDLDATDPVWLRDAPDPRFGAALGINRTATELLLYGGAAYERWPKPDTSFNDLWALSLDGSAPWRQRALPDSGPTPRSSSSAFLFAPQEQMFIISGGYNAALSTELTDCWNLVLAPGDARWEQNVGGGTRPRGNGVALDAKNKRVIYFSDMLALDLTSGAWSRLTPTGTGPTITSLYFLAFAAYDAPNERMIVANRYGEVWSLDTQTPGAESWSSITPTGPIPPLRRSTVTVVSNQGGTSTLYGYSARLWTLDLSAGQEKWGTPFVNGDGPSPRDRPGIVFDPTKNRVLLFGGSEATDLGAEPAGPPPEEFGDVWEIAHLEDSALADPPSCTCSTSAASDYVVGYTQDASHPYRVVSLSFGHAMRSGTYTIDAPANDPGVVHLKQNGVVIASTSYSTDRSSYVATGVPATITFDDTLSFGVDCSLGSNTLGGLPAFFDDSTKLVVSCSGCTH